MMTPELELVRSGAITAEQYVEAVERQAEETTPLGQVAIEAGLLSAREVFEVLYRQRADKDHRFGDIAIELGYLDRSQIALLLLEQSERRRSIVQHLKEMGALPSAETCVPTESYDTYSISTSSSSLDAAAVAIV